MLGMCLCEHLGLLHAEGATYACTVRACVHSQGFIAPKFNVLAIALPSSVDIYSEDGRSQLRTMKCVVK